MGLVGRNASVASNFCTSTSHLSTRKTGSRYPAKIYFHIEPGPHIRLMVDVLLTMNEAFCIAGVEFPASRPKPYSRTAPAGERLEK